MRVNICSKSHAVMELKNEIAGLNDQFRTTGIGGKIVITSGVAGLSKKMITDIMKAIREYTDWNKGNDPYGQHDFGVIALPGIKKVYFKIDYYDTRMEFGSENPADALKTTRVLTVMFAEEY